MKTLTYRQKKWAMSALLIAALGINVSFNNTPAIAGSADFASKGKAVEGEVEIKGVKTSAIFIRTSDDTVKAIVPQIREGKVCTMCDLTEFTLSIDKENKDNISDLSLALEKAVAEKNEDSAREEKKAKKQAARDEEETDEEDEVVEEPSYTEKRLARIENKCKEQAETKDQVACFSKELIAVLEHAKKNKNKEKNIEKGPLVDFVRGQLVPVIKEDIANGRRTFILNNRYQAGDLSAFRQLESKTNGFYDYNMLNSSVQLDRREMVTSLENLIKKVPASLEEVRSSLRSAQVSLVREEAVEIQRTRQMADQYEKTNAGLALSMDFDANVRAVDLANLDYEFKLGMNQYADGSTLSEQYRNFYMANSTPIFEALANPTAQIPGVSAATNPSLMPNPRIDAGRGSVAGGTNLSTLPAGTVVTVTTPDGKITQQVVPQQVTQQLSTQIPTTGAAQLGTQSATPGQAVTFGAVESASPANQVLRRELRRIHGM